MSTNKLILLLSVATFFTSVRSNKCRPDNQFRFYCFSVRHCTSYNCFDVDCGAFLNPTTNTVYIRDARVIPSCAFSNYHHLRYVQGVNKNIQVIANNAFVNLPKLEVISLPFNLISELHRGVFDNVTLRSLDLSWNKLVYVQEGAFEGIQGLTHLNLSGNELFSLPMQRLSPSLPPTLLSLNVSHNLFKSVTLLNEKFPNLLQIDFSDNELARVAIYFDSIEELDLSNNMLHNIDLYEVNYCEKLKLTTNNFTSVPDFLTYASIKSISIHSNPWKCSELNKLWTHLQNNRIIIDDSDAREGDPICAESVEIFQRSNLVDGRRCENDVHCEDTELCRNNRCLNPCKLNACEPEEMCVSKNHKFNCLCPSGKKKDPRQVYGVCGDYECFFQNECGPQQICDTKDNRCKFVTILEENISNIYAWGRPSHIAADKPLPWWYDEIPLLPKFTNGSRPQAAPIQGASLIKV